MIRPFPLTNNEDTYLNAVGQGVNNKTLYVGQGLKLTHHGNGVLLQLTRQQQTNNGLNWGGIYDASASYYTNDIVLSGSLPSNAVLFLCIQDVPASASRVSGSNYLPVVPSSSYWQALAVSQPAGGSYSGVWDVSSSYNGGQIVQVQTTTVTTFGTSSITTIPATYALRPQYTITFPITNVNMIPQFPLPTTGSVYWDVISLGITTQNVCSATGTNIYINSSAPF